MRLNLGMGFGLRYFRKREIERGTLVDLTLRPGAPFVTVNNSLDVRQSNTGALVVLGWMQTLKYAKELVGIFHVKTDTIVSNENHRFIRLVREGSYFNRSLFSLAREL